MIQKLLVFGFSWNKVDSFTPEKIENILEQKKVYIRIQCRVP